MTDIVNDDKFKFSQAIKMLKTIREDNIECIQGIRKPEFKYIEMTMAIAIDVLERLENRFNQAFDALTAEQLDGCLGQNYVFDMERKDAEKRVERAVKALRIIRDAILVNAADTMWMDEAIAANQTVIEFITETVDAICPTPSLTDIDAAETPAARSIDWKERAEAAQTHALVERDTIKEALDFIVGAKKLWLHADDPYIGLLLAKLQAAIATPKPEVQDE